MVSLLKPDVQRSPYQQTSRKAWPRLAPESSDAFSTCASVRRRSCHIYFYSAETAGCSHLLNGSSWIPSATVSGSSSGACTARFNAGLVQFIEGTSWELLTFLTFPTFPTFHPGGQVNFLPPNKCKCK